MPARTKSSTDSSAHLGFEATARRGSANPKGEAIPRSLEGNLWLSADSRGEAETPVGNRSNNINAAEPSGARQPAAGSPKGERGSVHQCYTQSCVVRLLVGMLAPYEGHTFHHVLSIAFQTSPRSLTSP